jgi:hypothetical protein
MRDTPCKKDIFIEKVLEQIFGCEKFTKAYLPLPSSRDMLWGSGLSALELKREVNIAKTVNESLRTNCTPGLWS